MLYVWAVGDIPALLLNAHILRMMKDTTPRRPSSHAPEAPFFGLGPVGSDGAASHPSSSVGRGHIFEDSDFGVFR